MSEVLGPRPGEARTRIDYSIISWRAWYTGGRVFSSVETRWADLPSLGLLIVRLYYKTKDRSREMSGKSLYWVELTDKGPIFAYDDAADALIPDVCWEKNLVKRGKWVTDQEMAEVREAAMAMREAPNEELRIPPRV